MSDFDLTKVGTLGCNIVYILLQNSVNKVFTFKRLFLSKNVI